MSGANHLTMPVKLAGLLICIEHLLLPFATGFNLDEMTFVVRRGQNDSQFGFTVAQHQSGSGQLSLLVGAPRMQTNQSDVFSSGAVLRCQLDRPDCQLIPFDERGNSYNGRFQKENKTLQWFGATLVTSKTGRVLACAPRYVYIYPYDNERWPVGLCYLSQSDLNLRNFNKYYPVEDPSYYYSFNRKTHSQYGFSAAFSSDGNYLMTGSVGCFYWQGQVQLRDLRRVDNHPLSTTERYESDYYTYMGYAVASGNFRSSYSQDFVVGMPKGNHLTGKVLFLDDRLRTLYELTGEQIGEYFGSAIAVADFNGDGLDDVAVGAPLYSPSVDSYDIGRVYVFYQIERNRFDQSDQSAVTKLGSSRRVLSRFGSAISSIGDLNLDGFDDLVVGAPYDGPNGRGAVYVFQGSQHGVVRQESQVCFAETFGPHLSAFGFSISGGLDFDNNGYPDLSIGAYKSDSVVHLRSRSVVKVVAKVKVAPEFINLEDRSCTTSDRTPVSCFTVSFCVSYSGVGTPSQLQLRLIWQLDIWMNRNKRALFLAESSAVSNTTMTLQKQSEGCVSLKAYIKGKIRDKLSPIQVSVEYSLVETGLDAQGPRPILDLSTRNRNPNPAVGEGHILKHCGWDLVCVPDLRPLFSSDKSYYILGSDDEVHLNVAVKNSGEDAFESVVKIELPKGVIYVNAINITGSKEVFCDSFQPDNSTGDGVLCDIGNPLPANKTISFVIRLVASRVSHSTAVLQFPILVTSANNETSESFADNTMVFDIPVKGIINMVLTGVSLPGQVLYNNVDGKTIASGPDIDPTVIHVFEIRNFGPGIVDSMRTEIQWPSTNYDGLRLFHLVELPKVVRGRGTCSTDAVIDSTNAPASTTNPPGGRLDAENAMDNARSRKKRDSAAPDTRIQNVNCSGNISRCSVIVCKTGPMKKDDSVLIQIRAKVTRETISEMQGKIQGSGVSVQSEAWAYIDSMPYTSIIPAIQLTDNVQVETFVSDLSIGQTKPPVDIWIIVLGVVAGCLLLLLCVVILWKVGFFKRNKKMEMERELIKEECVDEKVEQQLQSDETNN